MSHDGPAASDQRVCIGLDPEEPLKALLRIDPDSGPAEQSPEEWAHEHVHLTATDLHKNGLTWVATIRADGLMFEGRAAGPHQQRDAL